MNPALVLLPDFLLILFGHALRRSGLFSGQFWSDAEKFIYFVLFPPLLFRALARAQLDFQASVPMLLTGVLFTLAGFVAALAARHFFTLSSASFAAGQQAAYRFNTYVGFAVIGALSGPPGLAAIALLAGVMIPLVNLLAVWQLARAGGGRLWGELARNPLIWGIVAGLSANLSGLSVPDWLFHAAGYLADSALPLGLITVGAGLRFAAVRAHLGPVCYWTAIKLVLVPAVALALAAVFGLTGVYRQAALVMALLPTATSTYILAVRMGGDGTLAASLVTVSTLAAMVSMPLFLAGFA